MTHSAVLRNATRHPVVRTRLAEAFGTGDGAFMPSLFGTLTDYLERFGVYELLDSSEGRAALHAVSRNRERIDLRDRLSIQRQPALAIFGELQAAYADDAVFDRPLGPPDATEIRAPWFDMERGTPVGTGRVLRSAQPGTLICIVGQGFSPRPDQNIVRFGSVRAPVVFASAEAITTLIPLLYEKKPTSLGEYVQGTVRVSVETPVGSTSLDFEIEALDKNAAAEDAYSRLLPTFKSWLGAQVDRTATIADYARNTGESEIARAAEEWRAQVMHFCSAAADAALSVFRLAESAGVTTVEVRQTIGQMVLNSRILERLDEQLGLAVSPGTSLLRGSGVTNWLCKQTVTAWEAVLVMIITIVVTFIVALIFLLIPGKGWAIAIVLAVFIKILISWLVVMVAVAVAVTIVYGIAKGIEAIWDWFTKPSPAAPAAVPSHGVP